MRTAIGLLSIYLSLSCDTIIWEAHDDGGAVLSCQCPTGDLLVEHLARYSYTDNLSAYSTANRAIICDPFPDWLVVGGDCAALPLGMDIAHSGFTPDFDGLHQWSCRWHNPLYAAAKITTSAVCIVPLVAPDVPAECDCPPVQNFRDRIYARRNSAPLVPDTVDNTMVVTCEPGDVLLNGGCETDYDISARYLKLTSSGFDAENPDAWRCMWNHLGGPQIGTMTATAMCMRPPDPNHAPETEPLAERITRRATSEYLKARALSSSSTPCLSDEYVLGGSCMLDHTESASYEANLNMTAYDPFIANSWRCAWYESTNSATVHATTTALCLRPPAP